MKKDEIAGEGASITTIGIQVPLVIKAEQPKGKPRSLNLAQVPEETRAGILGGLLARGLTIVLRDGWGTTDGPDSDKEKEVLRRLAALQDGTYQFGAGGGSRSDSRTDAWGEWLRRQGFKEGGTNKGIRQWQLSRCAAALIADGVAKDKAVAEAEECLAEWLDYMEEQNPALKALVENYARLGAEPMAVEPGGFKRKAK